MAALISGTSCFLSPEKLRATKVAPRIRARPTRSIGLSELTRRLALRALVGGGGELALGQAVNAVVLADIDHVDAAADAMGELAEPDGGGIAVAGNAHIDQIAIGEVGAGQHRRHAAMHAVEAVALAEQIVRRLRRTADARKLRHAMRLDVELETGLDQRGADRIVAAAGAQRRDRALIVAMGEAEHIRRKARMAQLGFGDVGHSAASLRALSVMRSAIASVMKRAVMGVPS